MLPKETLLPSSMWPHQPSGTGAPTDRVASDQESWFSGGASECSRIPRSSLSMSHGGRKNSQKECPPASRSLKSAHTEKRRQVCPAPWCGHFPLPQPPREERLPVMSGAVLHGSAQTSVLGKAHFLDPPIILNVKLLREPLA